VPTLQIAVCSDAPSPARAACLAALAREGADPILVGPGHVPPGMASARNAALAACEADVIAFVDEDVVVPAGWLARLRAAWEAAPADRGAIGGPLAVTGGPPWLTSGLAAALGTLDFGDEPLVLDAQERTLHGGNLSFRTSALRGAGGFWPARGRDGQRDWFGQEHHVQRELARGGWTVSYEPALAAERGAPAGLTVRDILRRRLAYGARNELVGAPVGRGAALRGALSGLAAALVAASRTRRAERAARAAQAAGALAARRVAHADLQPAATSTPFLSSVPEPQPRRSARPRRAEGGQTAILLYHRVADEAAGRDLGLAVSPAAFASQLEVLGDRIVALDALAAGEARPGSVALTFDDGYADNLAALRDAGVPATVFVSTGHVAEGQTFWWDELERLLRTATTQAPLVVELDSEPRAWRCPEPALGALNAMLQPLDAGRIEHVLAQVRGWAAAPAGADPLPLTLDELRELAGHATIGAHTRTHANLAARDEATARAEIERSRDDLAAWLGTAPTAFAYPFGVPGRHFGPPAQRLAAEAGFSFAVANAPGLVGRASDRLALPRLVAPDLGGEAFAAWLAEAGAPPGRS
jgi:peptidoglycan/xylan/chitin deacetylase (PgdA/CDA1 family)